MVHVFTYPHGKSVQQHVAHWCRLPFWFNVKWVDGRYQRNPALIDGSSPATRYILSNTVDGDSRGSIPWRTVTEPLNQPVQAFLPVIMCLRDMCSRVTSTPNQHTPLSKPAHMCARRNKWCTYSHIRTGNRCSNTWRTGADFHFG